MKSNFDGIKQVMLIKGVSKKELAYMTGLSLSTINRVFNNQNISLVTLEKVCKALEIEWSVAFGNEDIIC